MTEITKSRADWLKAIDNLYISYQKSSNNNKYILYPRMELTIFTKELKLLFKKVGKIKTQIIFQDSYNRNVYLTDIDIILALRSFPDEEFRLFSEYCALIIKEKDYRKLKIKTFTLEDFTYEYIDFFEDLISNNADKFKKNYYEHISGIYIAIADILILISLILNKELLVDFDNNSIRVKRQLMKFYLLSNFYKDKKFSEILDESGYKIDKSIYEVYYNNRVAKKIDLCFDKIEF